MAEVEAGRRDETARPSEREWGPETPMLCAAVLVAVLLVAALLGFASGPG